MGLFSFLNKAESLGGKAYRLHSMGNQQADKGEREKAAESHKQALELYAQSIAAGNSKPVYFMAYGVLLMRFGRFDEAKAMFLKAEKAPGITKAEKKQLRVNFAIAQWKLGNLDSAIEQMKYAKSDGNTGVIYGSLGFMLIEKGTELGDYTEAIAFNEEALEYDDEDAVVLDNMGQLNLRMGNREKALEFFERAHERKPSQVDTLYYLAKLAAKDGQTEKAIGYLETALEGNYSSLATVARSQVSELYESLK